MELLRTRYRVSISVSQTTGDEVGCMVAESECCDPVHVLLCPTNYGAYVAVAVGTD